MLQCMMLSTHCGSHTSTYTLLQHVSAKLKVSLIALRLVDRPIPFPLSPFHFPPPPLLPSTPLSLPTPRQHSHLTWHFPFSPLLSFPVTFFTLPFSLFLYLLTYPLTFLYFSPSSPLPFSSSFSHFSVPSGYSPCALVGPCTTSSSINRWASGQCDVM